MLHMDLDTSINPSSSSSTTKDLDPKRSSTKNLSAHNLSKEFSSSNGPRPTLSKQGLSAAILGFSTSQVKSMLGILVSQVKFMLDSIIPAFAIILDFNIILDIHITLDFKPNLQPLKPFQ